VVGRRIVRGHAAPVLRYRPGCVVPAAAPFRTPLLRVASLAVLTMGLTSCFTTTADFRNDAETFIEENDELRDVLFPGSDTAFETATCVEPEESGRGDDVPVHGDRH
jgi:hypothetical protein